MCNIPADTNDNDMIEKTVQYYIDRAKSGKGMVLLLLFNPAKKPVIRRHGIVLLYIQACCICQFLNILKVPDAAFRIPLFQPDIKPRIALAGIGIVVIKRAI